MKTKQMIVAIALLAAITAVAVNASRQYSLDLNYVTVEGDLIDAQRHEIFETLLAARDEITGLSEIRDVLEEKQWIDQVTVTRRWPDSLTVTIKCESAIAYWNDDAFINDEGRVFVSKYLAPGDRAHLYGPPESERVVMQQYQQLNKALSNAGQSIEVLSLDERGAWSFTTDTGMKVLLGKDDIMERIQRFLLVARSAGLNTRLDSIEQIDTRYSNGVAVGWKEAGASLSIANTDNSQRELRL